ncbi:MAG: hypothetical protein J6K17_11105 [Oscillospiraceae bacterium]|nr:hypothetical protein [Oscillospiraceae bacterium]
MENKKCSFWFVLLISLLVYAALKFLRTGVKILFGAITIFTDFSLLPPVSVFMGILTVVAVIVTVKLSGRICPFPLAVLVVELAYDVKTIFKSSDTLLTVTETADSLGWFNETVMTVIGSVGEGGRILYIIYCFLNSFVLFGVLLLISAVAKVVFDKRKKKAG